MKPLVFTDLDGTLLDHRTYSFQEAEPILDRIREEGWPLIFVTSKTEPEVRLLQDRMGIREPFVVENGGAVFLPPEYGRFRAPGARRRGEWRVLVLGLEYPVLRDFVAALPPSLGVRGLSELSDEEVVERTGLGPEAVWLARRRAFSEPCLVEDPEAAGMLREHARAEGLQVIQGGRFHHVVAAGQDKGRAVEILLALFREEDPGVGPSIGLGDSRNDAPMLERVDIPVVIPNPPGSGLELARPDAVVAPHPGPRGWREALEEVFANLTSA